MTTSTTVRQGLLTEVEVAEWTGLAVVTLQKMRAAGQGPRWVRLTPLRSIRYPLTDLERWVDECAAATDSERIGAA